MGLQVNFKKRRLDLHVDSIPLQLLQSICIIHDCVYALCLFCAILKVVEIPFIMQAETVAAKTTLPTNGSGKQDSNTKRSRLSKTSDASQEQAV